MATKEIKLAVYQTIKDNLERKFETLEKQKGDPFNFSSSQEAYLKYLDNNPITIRIIKELMLEGRLNQSAIEKLFNAFVSINTTPATPAYWNEKLENKYGFRKKFVEMMKSAHKEYAASLSKKKKTKVLDKKFTSQEIDAGVNELIDGKYALKMMPIFSQLHDEIMEKLGEEMVLIETTSNKKEIVDKAYPESIYLVTKSIILDSVIFLVIDEHFNMPIRFTTVNGEGKPTCITKLYNIAYMVNVPGKKVKYSKQLASDINNGLLRRKKIKNYLEASKLNKPTLVKRSEDKKSLVLNNDTLVKNINIQKVPPQLQYLYTDKTS